MSLVPRLALLALLMLLAACAGPGTRDSSRAGWTGHSDRLRLLQHWTASGKVALRSSEQAESASLVWRQQNLDTQLQLSGPMGIGVTTIHSDGRTLDIRRGDEVSTLDISSPDAIALNTGWDLPLHALPHWLKGIPSPDYKIQLLELDPETDLLRNLQQDDWKVHFEQYDQFKSFTLPTRLRIQRGTTSARLIIRDWQTTTN